MTTRHKKKDLRALTARVALLLSWVRAVAPRELPVGKYHPIIDRGVPRLRVVYRWSSYWLA